MPNQGFTNSLSVKVNGSPLPSDVAALFTAAMVEDSRNLPDLFVLKFRDTEHVVLDKGGFAIGAQVELAAQASDDPAHNKTIIKGEVTAVEAEFDAGGTVTVVRGMDATHRLFRGRRVAVYANATIADMARQVISRAGLSAGTIQDSSQVFGEPETKVSQDNVSDWDFLRYLADLAGAQVNLVDGRVDFKIPEPPSGTPGANDSAGANAMVLEAGNNLLSIRASLTTSEQVPSVEVRGWDGIKKQPITGTAPAAAPTTQLTATPVQMANTFSAPPLIITDVAVRSPGAATGIAKSIASQVGGAFAELDGVARGNPALRAGTGVRLAGMGKQFNGVYTLSSTRHHFTPDAGYQTSFIVSGYQERSLYGLVSRGDTASGGARIDGVAPGVVTNNSDPQKLGRVKVKLPWLGADYESGWARTVLPGAGKSRGLVMLPEVNDEVLVAFEQGDLDAPFVLGGLFNTQDTEPTFPTDVIDGGNGDVTGRYLVSRTNHRLDLVDNAGGVDGVTLKTGDGKYSLVLDKSGTTIDVSSDGTVKITAKQGCTVDAGTGDLELKGKTVKITATTDVSVEATAQLKLKGTAGASMEGATATVKGQGTAEISSSGVLTVRGSLVRIN